MDHTVWYKIKNRKLNFIIFTKKFLNIISVMLRKTNDFRQNLNITEIMFKVGLKIGSLIIISVMLKPKNLKNNFIIFFKKILDIIFVMLRKTYEILIKS